MGHGICFTGLLASGIIPAVRHCLDNLLTTDARIIPASATVFCQVSHKHLCIDFDRTQLVSQDLSIKERASFATAIHASLQQCEPAQASELQIICGDRL